MSFEHLTCGKVFIILKDWCLSACRPGSSLETINRAPYVVAGGPETTTWRNFFRMFRPTVYVLRRNILIRSHSLEIFYGLIDTQCENSKRENSEESQDLRLHCVLAKWRIHLWLGLSRARIPYIFSSHIVVIRGNRGCGSELAVEHHIGLCWVTCIGGWSDNLSCNCVIRKFCSTPRRDHWQVRKSVDAPM